MIFNFKNIFLIPNSPYNLVSLVLLNNYNIFYDNKNKVLYNLKIKEIFTQIKQ